MVRHPPRVRKICRAPGPGTRVITARRPIPRMVCINHGYPYPLMVHLWARTAAQGREPVHVGFYCWKCATLVPDDGVRIPLGDREPATVSKAKGKQLKHDAYYPADAPLLEDEDRYYIRHE